MASIFIAMERVKELIELELARAEAIVYAAGNVNTKAYEPVVENHKGQILSLRKILCLLDNTPQREYTRGDLLEWYVAARTDYWKCFSAVPGSDFWDHAFLKKGRQKAEINIASGTLMVWRPDGSQVEQPMPYKESYIL